MQDDARKDLPLDPRLLDELWEFDDPAGTEQRMRDALHRIPPGSVAEKELTTQIARAIGLQGRLSDADALLDRIDGGHPFVSSRIHLERGRLRNSAGDPEAARPLLSLAFGHATASGIPYLAVDAAHMLAIVEPDRARDWVRLGLEIIETSNDPLARRWRGALHNNLGWTLHERGELEPALEQFQLALTTYQAAGTTSQIHRARWAVARCLRSLGRYAEAMEIQQQLANDEPSDLHVQEEIVLLREKLGEE